MPTRVIVWNEGRHEKKNPKVAEIYPDGIHGAIAAHLRKCSDFQIHTATLDCDAEHGCSEATLKDGSGKLLAFGTETCSIFPVSKLAGG